MLYIKHCTNAKYFFISITIFTNISLKQQECIPQIYVSVSDKNAFRSSKIFCMAVFKFNYFSLLCLGSSKLVRTLYYPNFWLCLQDNMQIWFHRESEASPTHLAAFQHQPVMMIKITGLWFHESKQRILTGSKSGSLLLLPLFMIRKRNYN